MNLLKKADVERVKRAPSFAESVIVIGMLVVLIGVGYIGLKWPVNPILILASMFATIMAIRCGWTWQELQDSISKKFSSIVIIILMNFLIGATISALIYAGTIPYMVVTILKIINPSQIYFATFLSCALFSLVTGTSWTTAATIGLAMFGVAVGMGADVRIVVGSIVSGAIFGDKLSPLSETTNLAPLCVGTTVFEHIHSMLYTTIPTAIICAIFFYMLGAKEAGSNVMPETATALINEMSSMYNWNVIVLLPFLIILGGAIVQAAAMPTMVIATTVAVFIGVFYQGISAPDALNALLSGMKVSYLGVEDAETLSKVTVSILQRGGMNAMAGTNVTVCCGYVYAAIVGAVGFIQTAMRPVINLCRGNQVKLITATLLSDGLILSIAGSSYPAHIIVSEIYKEEYFEQGLDPKVLSRTLEDVGTMCTPLVPWTASGAYYIGLFGVAGYGAAGYLKFALNCWLNPIAAIVLAITGIGMFKMSEAKKADELAKLREEAVCN